LLRIGSHHLAGKPAENTADNDGENPAHIAPFLE
jgi:hypothetical protein